MAFLIALIAAAVIFAGFHLTRNVKSKFKLIALRFVVSFGGFMCIPVLHLLFDLTVESSSDSGAYFFWIVLCGAIVSAVLGKKKTA